MKRILIIAVVLAGILYLADFLSVRFRIPARDTFGTVTVHTYYVVKLKNGRTEYDYAGDHDVSCSNSMFPQFGVKPCWYARRHTEEQIKIDSGSLDLARQLGRPLPERLERQLQPPLAPRPHGQRVRAELPEL